MQFIQEEMQNVLTDSFANIKILMCFQNASSHLLAQRILDSVLSLAVSDSLTYSVLLTESSPVDFLQASAIQEILNHKGR